jgi:hypothetical protein
MAFDDTPLKQGVNKIRVIAGLAARYIPPIFKMCPAAIHGNFLCDFGGGVNTSRANQ